MSEPGAIVAIWINVPAGHREEFRRWHNCEHSTERLEGPGFRVCLRYNAAPGGEGRHGILCLFEGDDLAAFDSAYYLRSRNHPTPWTRACMAFIEDAERAVYRLEAACGARPRYDAPSTLTVRFDPPEDPAGAEETVARWREEHLPRLCAAGGVARGRLFRRAEALSATPTAEAGIQDTRPAGRAFLAFIEMETLAPPGAPAWQEADAVLEGAAMRGPLRERWWLDFVKWKREG